MSHYSRADNPHRKYLSLELTIAKRCTKGSVQKAAERQLVNGCTGRFSARSIGKCTCLHHSITILSHLHGSLIRFQVDTGAQCNVVPLSIYKKATDQ